MTQFLAKTPTSNIQKHCSFEDKTLLRDIFQIGEF